MKQRKNNPNIKWIIIAVIVALSLMCVLDPPFWLWSIADSVLDHTLSGDNWYKEQIQKDIDAGKNLNFPLGRNQYTHLHEAALGDYIESAKLLIGKGVDVERRAGCKETPLHRAAQGGSLRVAKLLIENGANIEAEDKSRDTPLFWAISAEENQKEILDLLSQSSHKSVNSVFQPDLL